MEQDLWQYLKTVKKPIVLYGMGNGADRVIAALGDLGIRFSAVFATDGFVRNKSFHGKKLSTYSELKALYGEMVVLVCFGTFRREVLCNIERIAAEQELYAPDVPVYGEGLFTNAFVNDNRDSFDSVRARLSDDISRKTFENIVNFKLSGKIKYLKDCETEGGEPYRGFFKLSENESIADLGAYTGDTALEFSRLCENRCKITAVEPDRKTFRRLLENTGDFENIRCMNACVSDKSGTAPFGMQGGRNSSLSDKGETVRCVTVDEICENENVSLIKADIEGEEVKAVAGMKSTLLRCKPKLQIACYHRTEDLIAIPNAVFSLRKDYRLYMRHFPYIPAWDTNYYFL